MLVGVGVMAAAVGVAIAFAGHGASGRLAVLGALATVAHVAAASVWIGGLAGLAVCVSVAGPGRSVPGRFSTLAALRRSCCASGVKRYTRAVSSPVRSRR